MRNAAAKTAFWLFAIVAWIAVISLGLAVLARVQIAWIATRNPYCVAVANGDASVFAPVPRECLEGPLRVVATPVTWEASAPKPPLAADWAIRKADESDTEKRARRERFPSLSEEDRFWFALGNGETVIRFGKDGPPVVYSDGFKRRALEKNTITYPLPMEALAAKARETAQNGQAAHAVFNLDPDNHPIGEMDFFFLPAPDGQFVYVFAEYEYRLMRLNQKDIPAGSRWEIYNFSYKKNFSGHVSEGRVSTNRFGYRSPDVAVPKPKNVFRILCLGGSTTYEGLDNNSTYPALLQKELRGAFPGQAIEVVNCGVEGLNSRANFLHMPAYLEMEPDLVVGYLGINDSQNDVQILCRAELPAFWTFLGNSHFLRRNFEWMFWPSDDVIRDHFEAVTLANLEGLRRIFARHGIRFALCSLAYVDYFAVPHAKRRHVDMQCDFTGAVFARLVKRLNPEIRRFCERNGMLYIPVCENITNPDWLLDSCHLTFDAVPIKAHIAAESLKPYIAPALEAKTAP